MLLSHQKFALAIFAVILSTSSVLAGDLASPSSSNVSSDGAVVRKIDEFSGFACTPYRYESKKDVEKTLGYIDPNKPTALRIDRAPRHTVYKGDEFQSKVKRRSVPQRVLDRENHPAPLVVNTTPKIVENIKANKVEGVKEDKINEVKTTSEIVKAETTAQVKETVPSSDKVNAVIESQMSIDENNVVQEPVTNVAKIEGKPLIQVSPKQTEIVDSNNKADEKVLAENKAANKMIESIERFEIRFDSLDSNISDENKRVIDKVAELAKQNQSLFIKINSYVANTQGNVSEAKRSSLKRAIKARKQLIESGVSPVRISVSSLNDSKSAVSKLEFLLENAGQ